jgi:hypothetical protein
LLTVAPFCAVHVTHLAGPMTINLFSGLLTTGCVGVGVGGGAAVTTKKRERESENMLVLASGLFFELPIVRLVRLVVFSHHGQLVSLEVVSHVVRCYGGLSASLHLFVLP